MDEKWQIAIIAVILIVLNIAVGGNVFGNFMLGMVSAVVALWTRRTFKMDVPKLVGVLFLVVLLIPFFAYLFWFALIGARTVPAQAASDFLVKYVTDNFLSSLPSTLIAGIGASIIDEVFGEG